VRPHAHDGFHTAEQPGELGVIEHSIGHEANPVSVFGSVQHALSHPNIHGLSLDHKSVYVQLVDSPIENRGNNPLKLVVADTSRAAAHVSVQIGAHVESENRPLACEELVFPAEFVEMLCGGFAC
jgi:hypothetical protein